MIAWEEAGAAVAGGAPMIANANAAEILIMGPPLQFPDTNQIMRAFARESFSGGGERPTTGFSALPAL